MFLGLSVMKSPYSRCLHVLLTGSVHAEDWIVMLSTCVTRRTEYSLLPTKPFYLAAGLPSMVILHDEEVTLSSLNAWSYCHVPWGRRS
jgi:hypothetical protein